MGNEIKRNSHLTRTEVESMINPYVDHTIDYVRNVLEMYVMRLDMYSHG